MIILANPEPDRNEFDILLKSTIEELNNRAKKSTKAILALSGNKLEPLVKDLMTELAIGSSFENSIELVGGQKFPDIIAKKYYGIEVKTTTQNHWKTTGNSVLETTRVEHVERIFLLFAKLASPIEFRYRPYEECLSEVVVTHSPRYLIDMNLEKGKTIFDKIQTPYNTLRRSSNPIKPIVDHYRSKLKPGEDLWWIDQENAKSSNLVIKVWSNLSVGEKLDIKNKAMVFFPELFGNRSDKFGRFSIWLITREAIVCPNIRDLFTATGKGDVIIGKIIYRSVPRILINLFKNVDSIIETLGHTSPSELSEFWGTHTTEHEKVSDWIKLVNENARKISDAKHLNIKEMLNARLQ